MRSATVWMGPATRERQWRVGSLLIAALVLASCGTGGGGAPTSQSPGGGDGASGGAATGTATQSLATGGTDGGGSGSGPTKFHIVIAAGPHPGTYDLAGEECVYGFQGTNSWGGSAESGLTGANDISAAVFTIVTNPVAGATGGASAQVTFGTESAVLYVVATTNPSIDDRGTSATIVLKGPSTAAKAADGTISDGGQMEVTVECGEVARAPA